MPIVLETTDQRAQFHITPSHEKVIADHETADRRQEGSIATHDADEDRRAR